MGWEDDKLLEWFAVQKYNQSFQQEEEMVNDYGYTRSSQKVYFQNGQASREGFSENKEDLKVQQFC